MSSTTERPGRPTRRTVLGVAALAATVGLWSSFALSTRALGGMDLTTADAALLRFTTPVVLLSPWLPRTVRALRRERGRTVALVVVAGLPHFLLFTWGAQLTSAALTGLLVPGTVPLFVTLLLTGRRPEPLPAGRVLALVLVVAGVGASAALVGTGASSDGIAVLLAAGFVWALYTIGLQATGLDLVGVVLAVCSVSAVAALAVTLTGAMPSHLLAGTAPASDVLLYVALQGVGTGICSTVCYVAAVKALGGPLTAVAGAASPVLTAVVAVPVLGEPLTAGLALALALVVAGVVTFNLVPARTARRPTTGRGRDERDGPGVQVVEAA